MKNQKTTVCMVYDDEAVHFRMNAIFFLLFVYITYFVQMKRKKKK